MAFGSVWNKNKVVSLNKNTKGKIWYNLQFLGASEKWENDNELNLAGSFAKSFFFFFLMKINICIFYHSSTPRTDGSGAEIL